MKVSSGLHRHLFIALKLSFGLHRHESLIRSSLPRRSCSVFIAMKLSFGLHRHLFISSKFSFSFHCPNFITVKLSSPKTPFSLLFPSSSLRYLTLSRI
ncbi:hypothetical protein DY000_02015118 [Brassica cretica]|uniref:Uncharacterized protein n=1 Tax=Brassica cretica TaxID=69181 RepID=A0ABQ7CLV2_BRACR|nr:hypothetical protein DY000_02015118 [Brassica cretica]